jgi:hypothetical protein
VRRAAVFVLLIGCSRDEPVRADRTRALPQPSWSAVPAPSPSPSPTSTPSASASAPAPPPFDREAARKALAAVSYKHCKLDRSARVIVRFLPTGDAVVDKIGTVDALPSTTELCLIAAFETAAVPPFDGEPVTVAFLAR